MTPEQARDIYYTEYRRLQSEANNWAKTVVQEELSLKSWGVVIKAIQSEIDKDWAERYLAQSETDIKWEIKDGYLSPPQTIIDAHIQQSECEP